MKLQLAACCLVLLSAATAWADAQPPQAPGNLAEHLGLQIGWRPPSEKKQILQQIDKWRPSIRTPRRRGKRTTPWQTHNSISLGNEKFHHGDSGGQCYCCSSLDCQLVVTLLLWTV
eukprot:GHVT01031102.1.p1 GENE.GHVT01031102.1~~GHVT01031102.1.p1  ORF type:complete len:116 (+),score=16.18 GHVT01031102.1:346-693(+)